MKVLRSKRGHYTCPDSLILTHVCILWLACGLPCLPFPSPRTDICFGCLLGVERGTQPLEDSSGLCSDSGAQIRTWQCHQATTALADARVPLPSTLRSGAWWALHAWGHLRPLAMALCITCWCLRIPPIGSTPISGASDGFHSPEVGLWFDGMGLLVR